MRLRNLYPEIARGKVEVLNGLSGVTAGDQVSVTRRTWNGSKIIVILNLNSQEDENVILSRPVWDNHAFRGWYDNAEFTGDSVNTLVAGSTGDKVFYAKWAELSGYWNNLNWNLNTDGLLTISGWGDMSPFTAPQEGQGETEAWRPLADLIQRVQIINEVTSIGDYAFYSCENLIEVEIPLTVQRIDAWAFANDSSLTQISFPESLITIGAHAFSNDFNLTQISLPGNLEAI